VTNSIFEQNFFDGVAYYDSNEISTTNCVIRNNQFAGISLDNDLVDITFTRCQTESNGDVGVFARNVEGLQFLDCKISGSADWAVFLTYDLKNLGVRDTTFELCQFEENRRGVFMASFDEIQSSGTLVTKSTFVGNKQSGRENVVTRGSKIVETSNEYLTSKRMVTASE